MPERGPRQQGGAELLSAFHSPGDKMHGFYVAISVSVSLPIHFVSCHREKLASLENLKVENVSAMFSLFILHIS